MLMKSTTMTAVLVLLMLAVPGGIATLAASDQGTVAPGADKVLQGEIVDTTDDVTIERVDSAKMSHLLSNVQLPSLQGTPTLVNDRKVDLPIEDPMERLQERALGGEFSLARPSVSFMQTDATRGSDEEPNRDPWNGSRISTTDSVTATLTWKETDPQGTLGDYIDWYKMEIKGVDPTVPGSTKNLTIQLTSFSCDETDLYELTDDGTTITTDYLDFMEMFIFYVDDFWGLNELGGKKFWYDDGDDTDGWIYDGGHSNPDYTDNWTQNFEAPKESKGVEDTNGGTGGLTEDNWYYIGFIFNYYTQNNPPERPDFIIDYSFTVSNANDNNYFPVTPSSAGAPNDFNNATSVRPTMPGRTHSGLNYWDWYRFDGVNQDYIWNMSVWVNVSRTGWPMNQDFQVTANDNWMWVMLVWWGPGLDGKYDTADDIWTYTFKIMFALVYYADDNGDPLPFMQERFTQSGANNMFLNLYNVNNRTDATPGHPYLNGDARQMFIGLYSTPMKFSPTSTGGLAQSYADYQVWDQYNIQWSVSEVRPNTAPVVSDIKVSAEHPAEVYIDDPTGGYYETEFTIEATYTDTEGNLPEKMYVVFDGKDNKPIEIQELEANSLDKDVTDGKQYKMTIMGDVLTDFPSPHSIKVFAYDTPGSKYHRSMRSNLLYDNTSLKVWDDMPVKLVKTWAGLPVLSEDSQAEYVPLEGIDGAFDDPEKSFRGFNIWNPDIKGWVYDYEVMNPDDPEQVLVSVNVSKADGFWQAKLTLGENEHYSEGVPLLFRAYDDHSQINRSSRLIVNPVNDPPKVLSVKVGSVDYEADNTAPLLPVVHLDTQLTFKEDQLITFSIIAEDQDKENERSPLEYSYEPNPSSPWEGNPLPQVDMTTGVVTYTPTNGDVNKPIPNNKMVFTIDDRGADGDIKLTVYLKLENVNDQPLLTIPAGTRSFQQFTTLVVKPQASDEDRGDTLKFEVNFEEQIGDTPSVLDQLPYITPQKTLDWDINENTGEFSFKVSDQNIWKTSSGNQKTVSITLAFKVTDKAGLSDIKTVTFDLQDVNEEPPAPKKVTSVPADKQEVGKAVIFTVEEVVDPDGDKLYYKWNFGDGFTGEGVNVTHVYNLQGIKTVEVWVEDGQFQTDKYTYRIEIIKETNTDDDDDTTDDDTTGDTTSDGGIPIELVIGGIFLVVIIIVFIVIALLVLRKKPAPPAAQYPYDPALMGYNYQGLPPGAVGQLPPAQPPELPPAPDYAGGDLPPAAPAQTPAQAMAAPAAPPQQPGPEQMGGTCPSCNAPVDPSWFLCPNCKAPLQ